jgi:hypothetical protein
MCQKRQKENFSSKKVLKAIDAFGIYSYDIGYIVNWMKIRITKFSFGILNESTFDIIA